MKFLTVFLCIACWQQQLVDGRWGKRCHKTWMASSVVSNHFRAKYLTRIKTFWVVIPIYAYSELTEIKGIILHKIGLTLETSYNFGVPKGPLTYGQLATNSGFSTTTFRFDNSLEWLTELREVLYLQLWFYYNKKDTKQNQPKREMHRVKSGEVPHEKLLLSLEIRDLLHILMCYNTLSIANQGNSPKLW